MSSSNAIILLCTLSLIGCNNLPISKVNGNLQAPNKAPAYISQKGISGNACGPTSLINAFHAGSEEWQKVLTPYSTSKSAVIDVLKSYGGKPSVSFKKRNRWNKLMGMNLEDLTLTAQEMARKANPSLPPIHSKVTIPDGKAASARHLKEIHKTLSQSFKNGLPPIANISRIAYRSSMKNEIKVWDTVGSHSVLITKISTIQNLSNLSFFTFHYYDPALNRELTGKVSIVSPEHTAPQHIILINAPESNIFKKVISSSTPTHLSLTSIIGAF